MADERPSPFTPVHIPLPYRVVIRVAHEDGPPEVTEVHTVAYSVVEAVMQALMQVQGQPHIEATSEASVVKVEMVGPDEEQFYQALQRWVSGGTT